MTNSVATWTATTPAWMPTAAGSLRPTWRVGAHCQERLDEWVDDREAELHRGSGKATKTEKVEATREPAHRSAGSEADRNLLFGVLALQMDFITREALIAAVSAWIRDKAKPLARILVAQGSLPEARARCWSRWLRST